MPVFLALLMLLGPGCIGTDSMEDSTPSNWSVVETFSSDRVINFPSIAFSPDNNQLAIAGYDEDGIIEIWDISPVMKVITLEVESADFVESIAFSPDGSILVAACEDSLIRIWDTSDWSEMEPLTGHDDRVTSVAFSEDGSLLASGSHDGTVKIWSISQMKIIQNLDGYGSTFASVAFSNDGTLLAGGSNRGMIRIWSTETWEIEESLQIGADAEVESLAFSTNDSVLASASTKGISIWNTSSWKEDQLLPRSYSVAFSHRDSFLASGGGIYSVKDWSELKNIQLSSYSVAFSMDGSLLASAGSEGEIRIIFV
jgi:WD40 repeat protein